VPDLPTLHPNMADVYRERVTALADGLARPETATGAIAQIRALLERITVHRDGQLVVHGDLACMLRLAQRLKAETGGDVGDVLERTIQVVAGRDLNPRPLGL
jgi:site-specific DNA recombinase